MANNLPTEKKVLAISMLAESSSIRSIERVTDIHRDTIMRLGVRVGEACAKLHDEKMRGLNCKHVELDEIWGFVGAKRRNADRVSAAGAERPVHRGFADEARRDYFRARRITSDCVLEAVHVRSLDRELWT